MDHLKNKKNQLFIFIVVLAFYLRLQGIHCGLPYVLNPNESNYLSKILYLVKHFLNPNTQEVPSFFLYLNSIFLFVKSGTFDVNNLLSTLELNSEVIYLPLRFLSVLFGVGSVIVLYLIGSMFSTLIGILASGFLAVSFLHVKFSQMFLPFSSMVFFSLLSTFFALRCSFIASTVFAVLSTSMNYIGIVSIVPILFVLALSNDFSKLKSLFILFFSLFLILNSYFVFNIFYFLKFLVCSYIAGYFNYHFSSYLLYLFSFLLQGVGPVVWTSALFLIRYKNNYDSSLLKIVFSFPFLYVGLLGLFHLTSVGYSVMLVPYFSLAAALVLSLKYKELVFILLVLFAFWIPLKYTLRYNKIINLSDTRIIATEWIKENTTSDFKISWDYNSIQPNWYDAYKKDDLGSVVSDPDLLKDRQNFPISKKLLRRKDWFKILRKKVDYVVIDSFDSEKILRQPGSNLAKKYYSKILKLKPTITFNPYLRDVGAFRETPLLEELYSPFETLWERERPGPVIKIYKI